MKATVLVVEDEADIRLTFRIVLETAGHDVIEAASGEEALTLLETLEPDLMILDLRLPGIDGWQVLDAIRERRLIRPAQIVVASANAQAGQLERAEAMGCAAMLTKPFGAEDLRLTVAGLLRSREDASGSGEGTSR